MNRIMDVQCGVMLGK